MAARAPTDDREFFYEGFSTPNGTFVPDDVFDVLAPRLSEAELRVLLYIVRRTFGFGKHADAISLKQLTDGITARDGRVLDHGTGMSRKGVIGGIKGLLGKGVISVHRRLDDRGENQVNVYTLR
ncbi:MAG: replication protein, partial [Armatimonadetes bacterium]|nr:replication protein [Armatimonadota bacterium]